MGVHVSEKSEPQDSGTIQSRRNPFAEAASYLSTGLRQLQWGSVVLFGVLAGILMPFILTGGDIISFAAGIVPVGAGLLIGRRVKSYYGLNGFFAGLIGAAVSLVTLWFLLFNTPIGIAMEQRAIAQGVAPELATPQAQMVQLGGFIAFALVSFCAFGAAMSGRTEERNRQMRAEVAARGGSLERPPAVRDASDIRGFSLPQLGSYVNRLFKKQGFQFKDYRFIDKDKHLDIWMEHENEVWHLRLTVADKVSPGTIEGLYQEMKREGCRKGVVVTSTEFLPSAQKSLRDRPIVLIDGQTLFDIAEK
jgi:hypothetical protein